MISEPRLSKARDRLLGTASALFYADGIRSVGVDRVIFEASVTRATFYRHFPGKESLVVAYLEDVDRAARQHADDLADRNPDATAWLREFTRSTGQRLCTPNFRGCPFINAAAEYPEPASPVRQAVLVHRRWLEVSVTEAFRRAGHPEPVGAAGHWVVLRDGAMVAAYLDDPATARDTLNSGVDTLLSACGLKLNVRRRGQVARY